GGTGLGQHAGHLLYLVVRGNLTRSISRWSSKNLSTDRSRRIPTLSTARPPTRTRRLARWGADLAGTARARDILRLPWSGQVHELGVFPARGDGDRCASPSGGCCSQARRW